MLLLLTLLRSTAALAAATVVQLDYATYRGKSLHSGVTAWLGIRYAAPPVGSLRFAAPQDPGYQGTVNAYEHGDTCLATGRLNQVGASEDCLFLGVYAPPQANQSSQLPVYFFIQGGGFNANSDANYDASDLIAASDNGIVVVTFNYRVGVYGFLASSEVVSSGTASLNNGLRDQVKALEWVHRHISHFGGNPNHVVLGGDSAGAASVSLLLTMNASEPTSLFHGAVAESVSFAPILTVNESQYQFDKLAERSRCSSADPNTVISCLRALSSLDLQQLSRPVPYPNNQSYNPPLYMWNPVLDGELVSDYTYRSFNTGAFQRVPVIFGDDTNGGTVFAPRWTSTLQSSNQFLLDQFPELSRDKIAHINALYPIQGPFFRHSGRAWRRTANAYGEMRYMCPNLFIATAFAKHAPDLPFWSYRWNVQDPRQVAEGYGVPHVVEIHAIWGPTNTQGGAPFSYYTTSDFPGGNTAVTTRLSVGKNAWVVPVVQKYWTRFIVDLDPNGKQDDDDDNGNQKKWDQWAASIENGWGNRLLFDSDPAGLGMEAIDHALRQRCEYWWSIGLEIQQ